MKPSTTTLCIACCLTAGLTFAQDGERRPGADAGNRMAEFIKRLDANNDGKVTKDEFLAFSKKEGEDRFTKIDANGDGVADEGELKSIAERMRGGGDARRDGRGSEGGGFRRPPEGQGAPEGRRPEGAPPGEGRRPEGGPPGEGRRPEGGQRGEGRRPEGGPPGAGPLGGAAAEEAFKKMDANNDGSVTKEEFHTFSTQELDARYGRMDANSDGKVTLEEMKSATERLREFMRGRGMGAPGGDGGFRRPGGEGGEGGGFRRPPSQEGGERPRPEGEKKPEEKKPDGV